MRRQDEEACQTPIERLINSAQGSAEAEGTSFWSLFAILQMLQQGQSLASEKATGRIDVGGGFFWLDGNLEQRGQIAERRG